MKREQARKEINERPLTDFIALALSRKAGKNMYECPVCGSGSGRNGTGALHIYPDTKRVFCYAGNCFTEKGEDTLGALRIIWKCGETEALERAGYSIDMEYKENTEYTKHIENKENKKHKEQTDNTPLYRKWNKALMESPEALEYLHKRGITDDSIKRFNLGFCESWKHSKANDRITPTKRIIIPRNKYTYTARRIDKPTNDIEANYIKQVEGSQKDLFNLEALSAAETPFICEGELDAITLYQAGAKDVIAIGTTTNTAKLLEEAKKHPEAVYILALDNDEAGKEAQKRLESAMNTEGLEVLSVNPAMIYADAKDANEAYTKHPERFENTINYLQNNAQGTKEIRDREREAELKKRTGEGMLEEFLLTVKQRDFEPIPTGIRDIDRALEGGFIRKTLVTLGAPPAMGKTALAQWIFENIAQSGQDVLYINLEMSREQLLARSISRLAWRYDRKDISSLEVLRGYTWTEDQQKSILKAADIYKRSIAPYFIYNPEGVTNNIDSILTAMESECTRLRSNGKKAPLVCIDYLQLVDSGERDAIEGMKGVIFKLKDFAKRENTVVFVIVANNRASNKSGIVQMESGRDTSAIEYSGDIMLGLSYTAIEDGREYEYVDKSGVKRTDTYDLDTIRTLKKEAYEAGKDIPTVCKEVSLKVLKSRFTEAERRANLMFDGKHSTFEQTIKI